MPLNKSKRYVILFTFFFIICLLYIIGKPIPCIFHKITGLYCPGCGITRMFISIFKFDFKKAFMYNQFAFILLISSLLLSLINLIFKINSKFKQIYIYSFLILAILFTIFRNIPSFSWLRP